MKLSKTMRGALLAAAMLAAGGASAITEPLESVQINVFGLNCGPCGEAMRQNLQELAGAKDLVANLECGKIIADVPKGHSIVQGPIEMVLLSKGYTLKGIQKSTITASQARDMGDALCKS